MYTRACKPLPATHARTLTSASASIPAGFVVENAADKELILEECTTKQKLKISVLELRT